MEQEWISLNEFMKRNHIGYETALRLINSGQVKYQKLDSQYKIRVSKNENIDESMEKIIRENQKLRSCIKIIQNILNQIIV